MYDRIVVWDPENKLQRGALLDRINAHQVEQRGVVLLPVDPDLRKSVPNGSFGFDSWGSGWPAGGTSAASFCPVALYVTPDHRNLEWVARLVPEAPGALPGGRVTLVGYSGAGSAYQCPMTPVRSPFETTELGPADAQGGWTIRSKGLMHPQSPNYYSFALYGSMPAVRVAWLALSGTR